MQVGYLESRKLYAKCYLSQNKMNYIQKQYLGFLVAYSIGSHYEGAYTVYTILKKNRLETHKCDFSVDPIPCFCLVFVLHIILPPCRTCNNF